MKIKFSLAVRNLLSENKIQDYGKKLWEKADVLRDIISSIVGIKRNMV